MGTSATFTGFNKKIAFTHMLLEWNLFICRGLTVKRISPFNLCLYFPSVSFSSPSFSVLLDRGVTCYIYIQEALVPQSCPTLCNLMDCSPQGFSVHGILQVRILEWVAIPFSRGFSQLEDSIRTSFIAGRLYCLRHQGKSFQEDSQII